MQGTPESKDAPREKQESVSLLPPAVTPPSIYVLSKSAHTLNMSVELRTTTYALSPPPPSSTQVQQGCLSTKPLPRSTSWRLAPCQTQYQFTTLMELQMRMDPSWRKSRSYSSMANTWRKCTSQSPTLDGRLSSSDIHGLPITTQKLTGLTRMSPCLNALLSVKGSQMEAWWRMMDQNLEI